MVFDHQTWMPGDGPFSEWQAALQGTAREEDHLTLIVGIDLGKRMDHTAIAVLDQRYDQRGTAFYSVRWIKRFNLGTRYTSIASQLKKLDLKLKIQAAKEGKTAWISYIVDAGGVGTAAVELLERELPDAQMFKAFLTGGLKESTDYREKEIKIPKWQMVANLVALFDSEQIAFPKNAKYLDAMMEELEVYELHMTDSGAEQFGAKTGKHDDIVCAIGLAAWYGQRESPYQPVLMW